jgi:hypothetical protein
VNVLTSTLRIDFLFTSLQGCDLPLIERVVLWKIPDTFCALAQRAGRCMRRLDRTGEAFFYLSKQSLKEARKVAKSSERVTTRVDDRCRENNQAVGLGNVEREPHDAGRERHATQETGNTNDAVPVEETGLRLEIDSDEVEHLPRKAEGSKRLSKYDREAMTEDTRFLLQFYGTEHCRRCVWSNYFKNGDKGS